MGFSLFAVGNLLAICGLLLAASGYAQSAAGAWVVALVVLGELSILAGVFLLGDAGYERVAARSAARFRRDGPTGTGSVSAGHQGVGIALLLAHLITYAFIWTASVLGYTRATPESPFPSVFGLSFEQQGAALIWGVILAELLFTIAIYVLGPAWWKQLKQLFRYTVVSVPAEPEAPRPPTTLRYRLGLAVFVVGNLLAVIGMLLPAFGLASGPMVGVIAVILAAGEIISASSIFLLGKEGFKELKSRLFSVLKRTPSGHVVSLRRHRIGTTLLALHVVAQFSALIFPIASHFGVSGDGSFPTVLGLPRAEQLKYFLALLASAEVLFFVGVYTLGADWWGKFQALFVRRRL